MSFWTHIVASIDVDTCIECDTLKSDVAKMLEAAPKITGSEGDADVFVNVLSGYNVFSWRNGNHRQYQTRVVITVVGDLRDRMRERTTKEWRAFKKFVEKSINEIGFIIRNCSCNIMGY